MADIKRKVLINRHSPNAVAPKAIDMYLGEIAVSHPAENLSATTIYTKNGDVMVPFASCAMTMSMINNAIDAADVTYEVKAADSDAHIEVASKGTDKAKVFEVSSKNVMSEDAFNAYSATTDATIKQNYNTLSGAINNVLDIVTTAITGDDIIKVDPTTSGAGAYKLTHQKALAAEGFKKLTTDAYGHVTAATAVETADIEKLGFKTSSATTAEITAAIQALDVTDTAESGKYVSQVSETDGKISVERLNVSEAVLNNYTKGTNATAVAASDSINVAISKLENQIDAAEAAAATAIQELDSEAKVTAGKYLTGIAIADGKISGFTEAELPKLSSATTGAGNVVTDIQVTDHEITFVKGMTVASDADLKAVSGIVDTFSAATEAKFTATDAAIKTLSGNVVNYVDSVSGNIASVINAMDKNAEVVAGQVVTTVSQVDGKVSETKANVKDLQLGGYVKDTNATGAIAGTDTINAALSKLENVIGANKITNSDKSIVVTEPTSTATTTGVKVNINPNENVIKLGNEGLYTDIKIAKINSTSDLVKDEYVLYGTDGKTKLGESIKIYKDQSLVSITLEDKDGSGKAGQYLKYTYIDASGNEQSTYVDVSKFLVEAEFKSGVTADASGIVHGVVDEASETFLTVGANGFKLSGVQAAINAAKAAATTKVVEGTDAGNNLTIVPTTGDDSSVTYTVNLTDVASQAALEAEIAARKAVDGQTGQTYAKNTSANYIANASSLNDADVKLDAAIKAVSDKVNAAKVTEGASVETFVELTLDTATTAGTTALTINDSTLKTKIEAIDAAIAAETTAREDAIKGLDSTGTSIDSGHYITSVTITDGIITDVGESDKVNSASSADKVVNALTMRDATNSQAFDGSVAKSLTFGTSVTATGLTDRSSMSMTSGGVVDVEIIDCGEY